MIISSLFCTAILGVAVVVAASLPAAQPAQCLTPDTNGRLPAFLPDGKEVVYVQDTPKGQQVMIVDVATQKTRTVGEPGDVQSLSVSPDGKWLAITSGLAFARKIERINLADGTRTLLVQGPGFRSAPSWVDDGKKLLFSHRVKGETKWIKLDPFVDPPTQEEVQVVGPGEPTLSASGKNIALITRNERGEAMLKIVDNDGKTVVDIPPMISNSPTPARGCYDPAFSADETLLVYVRSDLQPMSDIHLRNLKTGDEAAITSDRKNNQSPTFAPDGSAIVFASEREGPQLRLWYVPLTK